MFLEQPKTMVIIKEVNTFRINCGNRGKDLGEKTGPGARAKADARKYANKNIFAEGFTPKRNYFSRPSAPSHRNSVKLDGINGPNNGPNHGCDYNFKPSKGSTNYKRRPYFNETKNQRFFRKNSINPQTKLQDSKSIDEALAILTAKEKGLITNILRPTNPQVNLDFKAKGLGCYKNASITRKVAAPK